jgi:tetratricopeptide (TPR) repeat protein
MLEVAGGEYLQAWDQAEKAAQQWGAVIDALGNGQAAYEAVESAADGLAEAVRSADTEPVRFPPLDTMRLQAIRKAGDIDSAAQDASASATPVAPAVEEAIAAARAARVGCRGLSLDGDWGPAQTALPATSGVGGTPVEGSPGVTGVMVPASTAPPASGTGVVRDDGFPIPAGYGDRDEPAAVAPGPAGELPVPVPWTPADGDAAAAEEFITQARQLQESDRYDEALRVFRQVMAADPNRATPYSASAYIYLKQGRVQEALASTLEALSREPEMPTHWMRLGDVYAAANDPARALAAYDRALSFNATSSPVLLRKGDLLWKMGREEEARAAWRPACDGGTQAACRRIEGGI